MIGLAAVGPPLLLALLLTHAIAPRWRSWTRAALAFAWGAVVAANLALLANERATAWAATHAAPERVVPWLVAPIVEELVKAAGLVALVAATRRRLPTARVGAVLGAIVGLGFAATENVTYYTLAAVQGGYGGLVRAVFLRGVVESLNHATFTAITGLGLGWATTATGALVAGAAGLAGAATAHAAWNAVAADAIMRILCNAPAPNAACAPRPDAVDLFVTAPLVVVATIGPAMLALALLLHRAEARAQGDS